MNKNRTTLRRLKRTDDYLIYFLFVVAAVVGLTAILDAGESAPSSSILHPSSFDTWWSSAPARQYSQAVADYTAKSAYEAGWQAAEEEAHQLEPLIPWLEVPVPTRDVSDYPGATPGMTALDHCLAGLEDWRTATDVALITTRVGAIDRLFPPLLARAPPGIQIIGGFATSGVLPGVDPYDPAAWDFADPIAWQRIAETAQRVAELTGTPIVLLENEGALWRYHTGEESISAARLTLALVPLRATGLTVWWNLPSIQRNTAAFPDRRQKTTELTAAIAAALPQSIFCAGYAMRGPVWRADPLKVELRDQMRALVGPARIRERSLLAPSDAGDPRRYTAGQALVEVYGLPLLAGVPPPPLDGPVTGYPGARDWLPVAADFAALSEPRAQQTPTTSGARADSQNVP